MRQVSNDYVMGTTWLGFTQTLPCADGCGDAPKEEWFWILVVLGNTIVYVMLSYFATWYQIKHQPSSVQNEEHGTSTADGPVHDEGTFKTVVISESDVQGRVPGEVGSTPRAETIEMRPTQASILI